MKKKFTQSKKFYNRAKKVIPLATQTFSKSALQWPLGASPMFFNNAKGCKIYDVDKNSYIDYLLALLPIVLGYRDLDVDKAVKKQMKQGVIFSMSHAIEIQLAEELVNIIPYAEMVRFGKNGSDVLSAAVRLARAYTKKDIILVSGYHGWHDWFIGTTPRNKGVPKSIQKLTKKFKANDIYDLKEKVKKYKNKIAAIIIEPEGTFESSKKFLVELKNLCKKNGILLIFDEIICGFRISLGGAAEKYGVFPDLGCFGKSMANGYPISALVGRKKIMNMMEEIFVSGTFAGETLSMAASLATIAKLKKNNIPSKISKLGQQLITDTNKIIKNIQLDDTFHFSGNNWWPRLEIKKKNFFLLHLFRQEIIRNGLFMGSGFNLCYAHCDPKIISNTLNAIDKTFKNIKNILESRNPESYLKGNVLKGVFDVR